MSRDNAYLVDIREAATLALEYVRGKSLPEFEGETLDEQLLAFADGPATGMFVDWEPFDHPTLGAVEIGGFRPYWPVNPPPPQIADLGGPHGEFIARLGGMLPSVQFVEATAEAIGGGLWKVDATIENAGYFPTTLAHGQSIGAVDATLVQIEIDAETIVSGDAKAARTNRIDGSGATASFSWIIQGNAGETIEITSRAQKGGRDSITVTLR